MEPAVMNESTNPLHLMRGLWHNRQLIWQMCKREVLSRYRGSVMGLLWSFFNPVFMLTIYTFVFSVIFKAKWEQTHSDNKTEFAVILFAGLIIFNFFSEVINRSPDLIPSHVNYVKKVVFPIEILPVIAAGSALFHTLVSVIVLLVFQFYISLTLPVTALLLPVIMLPLLIQVMGCAWFLASLGVFLRDVGQTVGLLTTALLFLSPIFFPPSALPEQIQPYLFLNPLTFIIEQTRGILIFGEMPDWRGLGIYSLISLMVSWAGFFWFQKTRKGFADVL
jgi:lipopolysaccharide transport system permease protein